MRINIGGSGSAEMSWTARNAGGEAGSGIVIYGWIESPAIEASIGDVAPAELVRSEIADIVHEFNNALGAIVAFAKLLTEDLDEGTPQRKFVDHILSASGRGRDLVRRIAKL
jgi:signal transduction histidine kinase